MPIRSLKSLKPDRFGFRQARHLLNRAGFGGTPSRIRALASLGLHDAVDHLVDYREIPYRPVEADAFDRTIMRPATPEENRALRQARESGDEAVVEQFRKERQRRQAADRKQMAALRKWWLQRMIETPRPLEERMTLFWHGHFATGYRAIEDSYHMFLQNQLLRAHAVGNFKRLVHAIIRDPAMLRYLNNDQNRRQRPNENLARELMELFTLGEGNGYTENDIKEAARALTGYTFNDDAFVFRPRMHDNEPKRILGRVGNWDGDDLVNIIFSLNFVSEFICLKLYRFFVNDLPDGPDEDVQGFIRRLAKRFRDGGYDVRTVLRALFKSEHFYDEANIAAQIKSPIQLIVQTIRALGTPSRDPGVLLAAADLMGQSIFHPPSVKGWDGGRAWINTSTFFVRQNVPLYLLTGRRPDADAGGADGEPCDVQRLIDDLQAGDGTLENRDVALHLLRFALNAEPHPQRIETVMRFIDSRGGGLDNDILIAILALITAMPEYQLC